MGLETTNCKKSIGNHSSAKKSLNEITLNNIMSGEKVVLNSIKMFVNNEKGKEDKNNKSIKYRLSNTAKKTKRIIEQYKQRETLLINVNKKLKEQVKYLIKTLAKHEIVI